MSLPPHNSPKRRLDPILVLLAVVGVVGVAWFGASLGSRPTQVAVFWLVSFAVDMLLFVTGVRIFSLKAELPVAHRRMWGAMGFAGLAFASGVVLQAPTAWRDPGSNDAALGATAYSICVLIGSAAVVWALLTAPIGFDTPRARLRFWLDVVTVMVAAAAFGLYFTIQANDAAGPGPGAALQVIIGPTGFLLGAFAAVKLLLSDTAPFTFWAGTLGLLGGAMEGVIRGVRPTLIAHGLVRWEMGCTLVVVALLCAAARVQLLQTRSNPQTLPRTRRRVYSVLPYAAIGSTYLLMVGILLSAKLPPATWVVITGAMACTAVVVARQLAALADNHHLVAASDKLIGELRTSLAERDRLAEKLRYQASHDPLTGLANRLAFQRQMDRPDIVVASTRGVFVLLLDLDEFKPVNDRFGHAAGDQVLITVAARLRAVAGEDDC